MITQCSRVAHALAALCISVCGWCGCSGGPDVPVPADPNAESAGIAMLFDNPLFDDAPDRNNPCVWFDGYQNRAAHVIIRITSIFESPV